MFLCIVLPVDGLYTRPKHVALLIYNKGIVMLDVRKYETVKIKFLWFIICSLPTDAWSTYTHTHVTVCPPNSRHDQQIKSLL